MDTTAYRHIVFMNSSVRGPFLPKYFPVSTTSSCCRVTSMCTCFSCSRVPAESMKLLAILWQWILALQRESVPLSGVVDHMRASCNFQLSFEPSLVAAVLDVIT